MFISFKVKKGINEGITYTNSFCRNENDIKHEIIQWAKQRKIWTFHEHLQVGYTSFKTFFIRLFEFKTKSHLTDGTYIKLHRDQLKSFT